MKAVAALVGACVASCWSTPARAQSPVELELHACEELSPSALREHLDLELATLGLSDAPARLVLRCEPTAVAIQLYRASGARYAVEVRVELRDTARAARERLVALAATELVAQAERASGVDSHAAVSTPAKSTAPVPREHAAVPPARPRPPIELFVAGNAALQGTPRAALWGGSLGTRWGLTRTWSILLDTRFERGEQSLRLADVRWTLLSGFAGAVANGRLGPFRLAAGLGARAGWLALAATAHAPNEGRSLTAPWLGAAVPLRLAFDAGGALSPFIGAEVGYVLAPVRGNLDDGSALVEQRGPWLSGSLGVALAL